MSHNYLHPTSALIITIKARVGHCQILRSDSVDGYWRVVLARISRALLRSAAWVSPLAVRNLVRSSSGRNTTSRRVSGGSLLSASSREMGRLWRGPREIVALRPFFLKSLMVHLQWLAVKPNPNTVLGQDFCALCSHKTKKSYPGKIIKWRILHTSKLAISFPWSGWSYHHIISIGW